MKISENRPTIKDVARVSGVSLATVSRVINNAEMVSPELRTQVEAAIEQLGYEHRRARPVVAVDGSPAELAMTGLMGGLSTDIELLPMLMPDIINPYFTQIAQGVQIESAENERLFPFLVNTTHDVRRQRWVKDSLLHLPITGLIVCGNDLRAEEWISFADRASYPIVFLNNRVDHPRATSILVNFEDAASRATMHLLSLNHTRIGYMTDNNNSEHSQARQKGIENVLARRGLRPIIEQMPGNLPHQDGVNQVIGRFMQLPPCERPTAIIIYNDYLALFALNAIRSYGLHVPQDISIVGFDNIPTASHANPPLTTIDVPKTRMGRMAYQMLIQLRKQEIMGGGFTLVDTVLMVRESSGPAPSEAG